MALLLRGVARALTSSRAGSVHHKIVASKALTGKCAISAGCERDNRETALPLGMHYCLHSRRVRAHAARPTPRTQCRTERDVKLYGARETSAGHRTPPCASAIGSEIRGYATL